MSLSYEVSTIYVPDFYIHIFLSSWAYVSSKWLLMMHLTFYMVKRKDSLKKTAMTLTRLLNGLNILTWITAFHWITSYSLIINIFKFLKIRRLQIISYLPLKFLQHTSLCKAPRQRHCTHIMCNSKWSFSVILSLPFHSLLTPCIAIFLLN